MPIAALVSFVAGVCLLQQQANLPAWGAIAFIAAAAILGLALSQIPVLRATPLALLLIVVASAAIGFNWAAARSHWRLADQLAFADEGRELRIDGTIASLPHRFERGVRFEFEVDRVHDGTAVPQRLMLGWYAFGVDVRPGQRWQFTVRLRRPHGVLNPGGFDLEAWLFERNLRATGYVRALPSPQRLDGGAAPAYAVERTRAWLRERLQPRLADYRYGGVLLALVIGDQRAIAAGDWNLFSRTGISHLVSISGLHITMIAGLIALLVAGAWRRVPVLASRVAAQTAAVVAGMLAALAYALLAGWGVPAQRTFLMLAVVAVAWLARGRIALPTALACAAAVVCLLDPWAVLAPGFWLSFGAVAAIAWIVAGRRPARGWSDWKAGLLTAARVQLAVTLALAPALIVLFHQLPLLSPVANAVAIPVVSWIVTPLALVAGALAATPLEPASAPIVWLAHAVFSGLAAFLQALAAPTWATWPIATPPPALLALAAAGVALVLAPPGWPLRAAGALAIVPMLVWPAMRPAAGEFWVTALDVGQGSAVLLETSDRAWLYDSGPRHSADTDAGERIILPYLRHRGIGRLDGIIVSHLDSDHAGGAASLLRSLPVDSLASSITAGHPALNGRPDVQRCALGAAWLSGAMRFEVLHPASADYARRRSTNAMSCVVRATVGNWRALLTGDIGVADEVALAQHPSIGTDWMMVPHHGSRTSSSTALLQAARPQWAAIQAGYRNRFGHPEAGVIERYQSLGIRLARSDSHGAVQWRFSPDGQVRVRSWRENGARYWHNRPSTQPLLPDDGSDDAAPDDLPLLNSAG